MSLGILDNKRNEIFIKEPKPLKYNNFSERVFYDVSNLVISFLSLSKKYQSKFMYSQYNKIPFDEIDPEFKEILKHEFADVLKDFINSYKKSNYS